MKRTYFCPKCRATLNPNVKLILTMAKGRRRSLILLSPRPGDYSAILPADVSLRQGEEVDFHCPACGANLRSEASAHLAEIGFRLEDGTKGRVDFSRRFGEHATYFVTKEQIRSYGENAAIYGDANFFGAGRERD
jgi:RNase P subunit RPR2